LVKGYRREVGTSRLDALLSGSDPLIIAEISQLEVSAAIVRRAQQTRMSDLRIRDALNQLDREAAQSFDIIRADDPIMSEAIRLARLHRLRGADALQLANALAALSRWPSLVFVSSDLELNRAAAAESLTVLDPTRP